MTGGGVRRRSRETAACPKVVQFSLTRYQHLTSREQNKLTPTQAQTVIAAAILRHLHAVITTGQTWDPVIATHGTRQIPAMLAA
jgi:hypothetical protein